MTSIPKLSHRARHARALLEHIDPLRNLARILAPTPDRAEDMAQEALAQVWAQLEKGREIRDLRPYLMSTLRNLNRKPGQTTAELNEVNMPTTPPEVWPRMMVCEVNEAISQLPKDQRALMRLMVRNGASYQELADRFGLPLGTVMSRISRARARLREEFNLPKDHAVDELMDDAG